MFLLYFNNKIAEIYKLFPQLYIKNSHLRKMGINKNLIKSKYEWDKNKYLNLGSTSFKPPRPNDFLCEGLGWGGIKIR